MLISVVDRHRFDGKPDSDPNFHIDADQDPDRHLNDAEPHADPIPSLTYVGK